MPRPRSTRSITSVRRDAPAPDVLSWIAERHSPGDDPGPLLVLTGLPGTGRSRAVATLREHLGGRGMRVAAARFTRGGELCPMSLGEDGPSRGPVTVPWAAVTGSGASGNRETARRVSDAVAAPLLAGGPTVVLVDDAQWADHDAVAVLEALVPSLRGSSVSCVVTVRVPGGEAFRSAAAPALGRLRAQGLATTVRLGPTGLSEVVRELRTATRATPSPELASAVRALTRGVSAAVTDVVSALAARGAIRVIDRHAYLAETDAEDELGDAGGDHLLTSLRRLGPDVWDAARALAVLSPLGPAAPALVAESLGATVGRADELLRSLREAGFVHRGLHGRSWRFLVPTLTLALRARAGPFERRRLSALAVTAVWSGHAACRDRRYLADCVAEAGTLLPVGRARRELVSCARAASDHRPRDARRWFYTASQLADDRYERADGLSRATAAAFHGAEYDAVLRGTRLLFVKLADALPSDVLHELMVMRVFALHGTGNLVDLERVAGGERLEPLDGAAPPVCQAVALCLFDRWSAAAALLERTRTAWRASAVTRGLGDLFLALADMYCGRPRRFERRLLAGRGRNRDADGPHWPDRLHTDVDALLRLGELRRAEAVLTDEGACEADLLPNDRAILVLLRGGSTDALDRARHALARAEVHGNHLGRTALTEVAADVLVGQGRPLGARDLIARTKDQLPTLAHVLLRVDAHIDDVLGEPEQAEQRLGEALRAAEERDLVGATDTLWAHRALLQLRRGDPAARRSLARLEAVHHVLPTGRAAMLTRMIRALVDGDRAMAQECLVIGRDRGVPWDLAACQLQLSARGLVDASELVEAHATFGEFDALLLRARTRGVMAAHGLPVPGRRETVTEYERLLARLVGEGLGNRTIAAALATSEKSVEGRLSRLFARTGYQSRIELAGAILSGEYAT